MKSPSLGPLCCAVWGLLALAVCLPSCTGNSGSKAGAGLDAGTGDAPDVPPRVDECNLVLQDCPAGMLCQLDCGTAATKCVADPGGTVLPGAPCSDANPCAKGNTCSTWVRDGGQAQICAKYCDNAMTDCGAGVTCRRFFLQCPTANLMFGNCEP